MLMSPQLDPVWNQCESNILFSGVIAIITASTSTDAMSIRLPSQSYNKHPKQLMTIG